MGTKKEITVNLGGPVNLLTLLFIGLKLTHYIDWSWLWVLAPTWIPAAMVLGFLTFGLCLAVLGAILKK